MKWSEARTYKFVQLYKEHECLWNIDNLSYRNKKMKKEAVDAIIKEMNIKGFTPGDVKLKIKNLRGTYNQELAKVIKSKQSGDEQVYVPNIKWFTTMDSFIRQIRVKRSNQEILLLDSNSLDYEDLDPPAGSDTPPVESIEYITPNYDPIISSSCNTPSSNTCSTVSIPAKRGKRKLKQEVDDDFPVPVSTANEYIEEESLTKSDSKTEDRYDAFGKYVACKLREIGKKQSIFVEKIINEALFEGELGTLTRNHKIIDETQVSARPDVQYNAFVPYAVQCVSPNSGSSSPPQPLITDARSIYNVQGRFSEPETQSTHILP